MSDSTAARRTPITTPPPSTTPRRHRIPHLTWRPTRTPQDTPAPQQPLAHRAILCILSGLALAAAFPSHNQWYLAPLGIAGLALATRDQRPRRAALLNMITGGTYFLVHLSWSGIYVGPLPWIALATLEASYLALTGTLMPLAWRTRTGPLGTTLTITGLWVTQEAIRGRFPFGGFPWGRLAFSQADAPTLGYAAIGGAPLVTAITAATGALTALALTHTPLNAPLTRLLNTPLRRHTPHPTPTTTDTTTTDTPPDTTTWHRPTALAALALLLPAAGAAVPRPTDAPRTVNVAAVQGNVPRAGLDFNAERRAVLDNHVRTTIELAERVRRGTAARPDLVIWPENASDIDPLANADAAALIQKATDAIGVPVLVGTLQDKPDGIHNTSILWGPTGSPHPGPGAFYVKRHPAPFGEYIPYRSFFRLFSDKVDLVRKDFVGGKRTGTLDTPATDLGPIICFEVAYDSLVRDQIDDGADLLAVQTNNATFGHTDESVQQLAMSRLRAVETGRSVVHISTVGISALITPDGRTLEVSDHFARQTLQATLPLRTATTIAVRLGPAPEILLIIVTFLLILTVPTRACQRTPQRDQ